MKHFKPLSLSLQKEIAQRNICLESEIDRSMDSFGFRTMLHQCGIYKQRGYPTIITLYLMILLPFVKKCMTSLWTADSFRKMSDARKDTYYRFLNQEYFNPTRTFRSARPSLRPFFFDATDKQGDSCTESTAPVPAPYSHRKSSRAEPPPRES